MFRHIPRYACLLLSFLLATAGCGDSASGGDSLMAECLKTDESFIPCGGDLRGTWVIEAGCASEIPWGLEGCEESGGSMRIHHLQPATFTFDGTTITSTANDGHAEVAFQFPLSCVGGGPTLTCSALSHPDTGACSGGHTCVCVSSFDFEEGETTTPYSVSGFRLLMGEGWNQVEYGYCVEGDKLRMKALPSWLTQDGSITYLGSRR